MSFRRRKHVKTSCECRQQLDRFPLVIADSERDNQDSNLGQQAGTPVL